MVYLSQKSTAIDDLKPVVLISYIVLSLPLWATILWHYLKINVNIGSSFGRMIGYMHSMSNEEFCRLPPTGTCPFSSANVFRCCRFLFCYVSSWQSIILHFCFWPISNSMKWPYYQQFLNQIILKHTILWNLALPVFQVVMIALKKLWKMFFILPKKLFLFLRYSNFYSFFLSFPHIPGSKGQMEVE